MSTQTTLDGSEDRPRSKYDADPGPSRGVAAYLHEYDSIPEARRQRAADVLGVEPDHLDDLAARPPAVAARLIDSLAQSADARDDAREIGMAWLESEQ